MQREKRPTSDSASGACYSQNPANLINLSKYPLNRLGSPEGVRLVASCHERLNTSGICVLKKFISPAALHIMVEEAREAEPRACFARSTHNAYLEPDDDAYSPDHPRRYRLETAAGFITCDQLSAGSAIRSLYEWDPLVSFMGAVFGKRKIYRLPEPLGGFSVSVLRDGDRHAWCFDEAEYSFSLMLQASEAGGDFEHVPVKRSNGNYQYPLVGRVLRDEHNEINREPVVPGDLLVFSGRALIKRVTAVRGTTARLVADFSFGTRPNRVNAVKARRLSWGQVQ